MTVLLLFFFLSIIFSFLCSIWEAVLLSITPSYMSQQIQSGSRIGILLGKYKADIDRPLSAILTLNTIAHTVGAIGVGAQAGAMFGDNYFSIGPISTSYESLIAGLMTLAILILSEIIPKTLGANLWRQLAPFTVRSIKMLMIVLAPFVWLSQLITKNLKKDKERSVFNRADLRAMAHAGEKSGVLDESESSIIKNLLRLEKIRVRDVMTPRSVMVTIDEETSTMEFYKQNQPLRHSRIPIYHESPDNITGLVLKDKILEQLVEDKDDLPLKELKREILAIRDERVLPELFDKFKNHKEHLAIVVDEYGSVVGLITMEDIFETLLGLEIVDESDKDADLQALARKKWEERAKKLGWIE